MTKQILIVDDKEENRYLLRMLLQGYGYEVDEARNGVEALERAQLTPPYLIISDILMPVMDGFTLCREWKKNERLKRIPFIFYTATYTDERDRQFALSLGAARFIIKPQEPQMFMAIIREFLEHIDAVSPPSAQSPADTSSSLPVETSESKDTVFLKQYNEALIRKLEAKMEQLERTNRELEKDIAERKLAEKENARLEEQLRQSQKMEAVGLLAGGIAHDFNNILCAIRGYCDLMQIDLQHDNPISVKINEVVKCNERGTMLTRQLLAFSRRQLLEPRILNLNQVVADVGKMLHRLIGENITFKTVLAADIGQVKADQGQIEQVIMNLVVNSRDAMPNGGKLTIETADVYLDEAYARRHIDTTPGAYVMLAVTDNGCGMDETVKTRIFEPFFTTKEKGKGTGLGLATVYGIVKQSKGSIWCYSEKGKGTTFKVYLPEVFDEAPTARVKKAIPQKTTGTETILVAEDDEDIRAIIGEALMQSGYKVMTADNGKNALTACRDYKDVIHLLITDVIMPDMSGKQLVKILKGERPGLKVLYSSGYSDDTIVNHGVLDEGTSFLQKPYAIETLYRKVREVMDVT